MNNDVNTTKEAEMRIIVGKFQGTLFSLKEYHSEITFARTVDKPSYKMMAHSSVWRLCKGSGDERTARE